MSNLILGFESFKCSHVQKLPNVLLIPFFKFLIYFLTKMESFHLSLLGNFIFLCFNYNCGKSQKMFKVTLLVCILVYLLQLRHSHFLQVSSDHCGSTQLWPGSFLAGACSATHFCSGYSSSLLPLFASGFQKCIFPGIWWFCWRLCWCVCSW